MADIELVIKIPKEAYEFAKECKSKGSSKYNWNLTFNNIVFMIANGTPLPKGHGRLIDINEITAFKELECNGHNVESLDEFTVIIEADKKSESKELYTKVKDISENHYYK